MRRETHGHSDILVSRAHGAWARRQIEEAIRQVDAVIEVVDGRLPLGSRNPELQELLARRPHLIVGSKADLADPATTKAWLAHWESQGKPRSRLIWRRLRRGTYCSGSSTVSVHVGRTAKRAMARCWHSQRRQIYADQLLSPGSESADGGEAGFDGWDAVDSHCRRTLSSRFARWPWPKLDPPERGLKLAWIGVYR